MTGTGSPPPAADSEPIVTFNLDDFPPQACEPVGVEAIHPDEASSRPQPALATRGAPTRTRHRRSPALRRAIRTHQ
jgi:hypothetical protein